MDNRHHNKLIRRTAVKITEECCTRQVMVLVMRMSRTDLVVVVSAASSESLLPNQQMRDQHIKAIANCNKMSRCHPSEVVPLYRSMLSNNTCIISNNNNSSGIHLSRRNSKGLQLWRTIRIHGPNSTHLHQATTLLLPWPPNPSCTTNRRTERYQGWGTRPDHHLAHMFPHKKMECIALTCTTLIVQRNQARQRLSGNIL
jgi:hypothetical protein